MCFCYFDPFGSHRAPMQNPCVFDVLDTSADQQMTILGVFSGFSSGSHFWTLLGDPLECFWGSFWSPFGVLGVPVGTLGDPLASPGDPLASLWYLWGSHVASLGALWPLFGTLGGCLEARRGQKVYENQERSCRTGGKGQRTELD